MLTLPAHARGWGAARGGVIVSQSRRLTDDSSLCPRPRTQRHSDVNLAPLASRHNDPSAFAATSPGRTERRTQSGGYRPAGDGPSSPASTGGVHDPRAVAMRPGM